MKKLVIFIGMLLVGLFSILSIASATHSSDSSLSAKTLTLAWSKAHHPSQALHRGEIMMYAGQDIYRTSLLHTQIVAA